jgi:hypothetical protein
MDKTVVALFDDMSTAEKAVQELEHLGFSRDHISLMAANRGGDDGGAAAGSAADGAVAGAGIGAVLGGLAGLLVGIGALAIPGIGPIIAAGPLAAALGGAGIGAVAGGVIGALVDAGVPEEQAQYYAEGIRRGGTLVTVNASEGMADRATNILNRYGPVDINQRAATWRESGWSGFDADEGAYHDTGYSASFRNFDQDEDYFRQDFQRNYADSGYDYSYYQPGYRFGYELGNSPQFRGRNWIGTEADARRAWEMQHPNDAWEDFKDSVRRGWERFTASVSDFASGDEDDFRQDFDWNYQGAGRDYEQYRPAYRYGYDLAREDRFRNYGWSDVERDAQNDWQTRFPQNRWTDYRTSVQYGWNRGRTGAHSSQSMQSMGSDQQFGGPFDDGYFREDWQRNYASTGYGYERYQLAYKYGYQLANDQRYRGRGWNEIEPEVRYDWERQHPNDAWDDFKDAIRHGWARIREGVQDTFDADR